LRVRRSDGGAQEATKDADALVGILKHSRHALSLPL
jgi:hypothetical protein